MKKLLLLAALFALAWFAFDEPATPEDFRGPLSAMRAVGVGAALFLAGLATGVLLTKGAAWLAAKARIIEMQDQHDKDMADVHQRFRWERQALLRGEGIEMTVVHGIGEAGASEPVAPENFDVKVGAVRRGGGRPDETVLPIRRRLRGERGA